MATNLLKDFLGLGAAASKASPVSQTLESGGVAPMLSVPSRSAQGEKATTATAVFKAKASVPGQNPIQPSGPAAVALPGATTPSLVGGKAAQWRAVNDNGKDSSSAFTETKGSRKSMTKASKPNTPSYAAAASSSQSAGPFIAYCGNLKQTTTASDIAMFYENRSCKVAEVVMAEDEQGNSRGWGHVTFVDKNSLLKCLKMGDGSMEDGSTIKANLNNPTKVFLGGISSSSTMTQEDIRSLCEKYGPVSKLELISLASPTKCCFITFANSAHAIDCVQRLNGQRINNQTLRVNFPNENKFSNKLETRARALRPEKTLEMPSQMPDSPERAEGEKIVLTVPWLKQFARSYVNSSVKECPENIAQYCAAFTFKHPRPALLGRGEFQPEPRRSNAHDANQRSGPAHGSYGSSRQDGDWDSSEIENQSQKEVNRAEQKRLQFEKERLEIQKERENASEVAGGVRAVDATAPTSKRYHDEADAVMASLMGSAQSVSIVDNNVGRIGGKNVDADLLKLSFADVKSDSLLAVENIDSFLQPGSSFMGDSAAWGESTLGLPSIDIGHDSNSALIDNDAELDVGEDMFDFESLLNDSTIGNGDYTDLTGGMMGLDNMDTPESPSHAVLSAVQPLATSALVQAKPNGSTRISVADLLLSGNNSTPVAKPKDVMSLYEVESGTSISSSEKIDNNTPSASNSASNTTNSSPFAFHGSSSTAKTSATKKKTTMSAASKMSLLKLKLKETAPLHAGSDANNPATGFRKVNVNSLFGK